MKILAMCATKTVSMMRRVIAPFSVLSSRGHTFSFMEISAFSPTYAASYDVTVLPNWVLQNQEVEYLADQVARGSIFAYDLASLDLLQIPQVLATLRHCKLVTTPTDYIAKEVHIAVPGIKVVALPSTIDIPYMMTAHSYTKTSSAEAGIIVGCFGSFDWEMVKEPLQQLREHGNKFTFIGDTAATRVLGDLVFPTTIMMGNYPQILRQCDFGLMPIATERGQDRIWQHEFGILCKPMIHDVHGTEKWLQAIKKYAYFPQERASAGQRAHEQAKASSAIRLAIRYLNTYQKIAQLSDQNLY